MAETEKDAPRQGAAKDTQRARAQNASAEKTRERQGTDSEAETHSELEAPEGNAPAPEQPEQPTIGLVDQRVHISPTDRGTYVGPPVARNGDVEIPDEYVELPEESEELTGKSVDVFQVIASNGALALRLDNDIVIFDREQSRAFRSAISGALANVVS